MVNSRIDKEKTIKYYTSGAEDDFKSMMIMFNSRRYTWSLFIGHLMLEKLLKAYYVKNINESPPYIHNLLRLAEKTDLSLSEKQKAELTTITLFNINARYDDFKMSFHNRCTPEFSEKWITIINEFRQWIKGLILQ